MMMRRTASLVCTGLVLFVLLPGGGLDGRWPNPADRVDDAAFWRLSSEFSEPGGSFQSDNLVSNERSFPDVLPEIARRTSSRSAYVGVGPEQNFSYLAALRPRVAFIVDIRRQNAILHLLYKAVFELAPNRTEFLSRLFCRPKPQNVGPRSSARELFEAFAAAPPRVDLLAANLEEVRSRLVQRHHFALSRQDLDALKYVYDAFFEAGPDLSYSNRSGRRGRQFPSYAELMAAADDTGVVRSYLANEENYQALRELQQRNLVIPVVGDFAGPKAFKAVGGYLAGRGLTVTALYASNVEFYLFRNDVWRAFYGNVAALPIDRRSVLVRSLFRGLGGGGMPYPGGSMPYAGGSMPYAGGGQPFSRGGMLGRLVLDSIEDLVGAFRRGEIASYADVLARPGVRIN
jgi:hypothetical protein